jgi:hypothetical protein
MTHAIDLGIIHMDWSNDHRLCEPAGTVVVVAASEWQTILYFVFIHEIDGKSLHFSKSVSVTRNKTGNFFKLEVTLCGICLQEVGHVEQQAV